MGERWDEPRDPSRGRWPRTAATLRVSCRATLLATRLAALVGAGGLSLAVASCLPPPYVPPDAGPRDLDSGPDGEPDPTPDAEPDPTPDPDPDATVDGGLDAGGPADGSGPDPDPDPVVPDGGVIAPLGVVASGTTCGWTRERVELPLDAGVVFAVSLTSPAGDDPDLALYPSSDPGWAFLIGRAAGDDELLVRGRSGEDVVAEVSSYNGDCVTWQLSVSLASAAEVAALVPLGGSVRYEDRVHDETGFTGALPVVPARGARVDLVGLGPAGSWSTTTRADGTFTLEAPLGQGSYQLRATATVEAFGQWARVRDRSQQQALYAVESATFGADAPLGLDVVAAADDVGGAFNIIDRTFSAYELIGRHSPKLAAPLTYSWQRGQPFGCGSCYSGNRISLGGQFEDPDEYDDDIILHEFGHYFAATYAPDDSPGGSHRDMRVDPRLAWGEGLAYFFAALVKGDPAIIDNYIDDVRFTDLEAVEVGGQSLPDLFGSSDGTLAGDLREEIPGALLWDAYDDDDAEAHDSLALGEDGVMAVLLGHFGGQPVDVGPADRELADWLHGVACKDPGSTPASQALLDDRQLPWPAEAGVASCLQKTLRDEPDVRVVLDGGPGGKGRLVVRGPAGLTEVRVGTLRPDGTRLEGRTLACPGGCALDVGDAGAHWVEALVQVGAGLRSVWRTAVAPAQADAFRGGGALRPAGKLGFVRVWPARRR